MQLTVQASQVLATAHSKIIMYTGDIHHWLHILAGWRTPPLQNDHGNLELH